MFLRNLLLFLGGSGWWCLRPFRLLTSSWFVTHPLALVRVIRAPLPVCPSILLLLGFARLGRRKKPVCILAHVVKLLLFVLTLGSWFLVRF
jgi:hypothetical protein